MSFAFSGIVGNNAATLLTTIEEMHLLSKKIFFNSLSLHASKLMDKVCSKNVVLELCECIFHVQKCRFAVFTLVTIFSHFAQCPFEFFLWTTEFILG